MYSNCQQLADLGYCEKPTQWLSAVQNGCKSSCNTCNGKMIPKNLFVNFEKIIIHICFLWLIYFFIYFFIGVCKDVRPTASCQHWAKLDWVSCYQNKADKKWVGFMQENCRKTSDFCAGK